MKLKNQILLNLILDKLIEKTLNPLHYLVAKNGHLALYRFNKFYYFIHLACNSMERNYLTVASDNAYNYFGITSKKESRKIALNSRRLIFLESLRVALYIQTTPQKYFSEILPKTDIKQLDQLKSIIFNSQNRKIIFCHTHSASRVDTIIKLGTLFPKEKNQLYIQRGFSKELNESLKNYASYYGSHLATVDVNSENRHSLMKEMKKADVIHMFTDLSINSACRNYSYSEIEINGQKGHYLTGAIELSLLYKAILIPVFTTGNTKFSVQIGSPIDSKNYSSDKKLIAKKKIAQLLANEQFAKFRKYPGQWTLLADMQSFFRLANFNE
jgi:hypothetical protein